MGMRMCTQARRHWRADVHAHKHTCDMLIRDKSFNLAATNYLLAGAPIVFTMAWAAKTLQAHPLLWSPLGLLVAVSIIAAQITNSLIGTVKQVTFRPISSPPHNAAPPPPSPCRISAHRPSLQPPRPAAAREHAHAQSHLPPLTRWCPKKNQWTLKAGLGGFDINKKGTAAGELKVPESLGIVVGTMHMICVILFQVAISLPAAADLSDSRPVV
jgi:hypothetical protein